MERFFAGHPEAAIAAIGLLQLVTGALIGVLVSYAKAQLATLQARDAALESRIEAYDTQSLARIEALRSRFDAHQEHSAGERALIAALGAQLAAVAARLDRVEQKLDVLLERGFRGGD